MQKKRKKDGKYLVKIFQMKYHLKSDMFKNLIVVSCLISQIVSIPAIIRQIKLPMPYPTALAFGGPDYETLYVSSTSVNVNFYTVEFEQPARPPAGNLFKIYGLAVKGVLSYRPIV